jgi:hypothetical protein
MINNVDEQAGRALAGWEMGLGDGNDDQRFGKIGAAERRALVAKVWPDKVQRALAIYRRGQDAATPAVEGGSRADAYDAIAEAIAAS